MCRVIVREWKSLSSTLASEMMKGKFPDCGVKFTGKHEHGLVLAMYNVTPEVIMQKARAASDEISQVFVIPKSIANAAGLGIPTLTDIV
jgi:hypothetical protein